MLILSLHTGWHDATAVLADDYTILAAVQAERLSRIKGDGRAESLPAAIDEVLRIGGRTKNEVEALVVSRGPFSTRYYIHGSLGGWLKHNVFYKAIGKKREWALPLQYGKHGLADYRRVFRADKYIASLGLPAGARFFDCGHHLAHALSALFFTEWDNALLYTADGGGDWLFYSASHFQGGRLRILYGSDDELLAPMPCHSVGLAYGYMTQALGYKMNRHEGKLTGLAAFGRPLLYDALAAHFHVRDDGYVESDFSSDEEMRETIHALAKTAAPADAAASMQKLLEEIILRSIACYLRQTGAKQIGLAGGVFANVSLNRRVAELQGVEEVFIFPGMGDEGVAVGGVYEFLLQRDGAAAWNARRRRLKNVYWGGAFDDKSESIFTAAARKIAAADDAAACAAALLAQGKIVALYNGRMEFGPRALGARSILASPADKSVNDTLNKRLTRTEFMPFAPAVLAEDAERVFEVSDVNRYAMRFMTITCVVRDEWRGKIPAVVHVDGTARPQIITDDINPLYAAVLRAFKQRTGLPALVNTSFNAHEEPIIYTPQECLRALQDGRVDYVLTAAGVYQAK